jgi:anaerobic magnesium-protoporphyrin IX monomethyl ester cyclase
LINPGFSIVIANYERENLLNVPLGIVCVGTVLQKNKFKPVIIDSCLENDWVSELEAQLKKDDLLCVGISAMAVQVPSALKIARTVRKHRPEIPIVFGGIHATLFPKQTCQSELVDYVVKKEGDFTMLELAEYLKQESAAGKDYAKLGQIKGIVFKKNKEIIENEDRPYCKFSELPEPNWLLLKESARKKIKYAPVHSGRGCSHRCAFCINNILKNFLRPKSAEQVIKEMNHSMALFNTHEIMFWDENFFQVKSRVKKILEYIVKKELNVSWSCTLRADYFRRGIVDDEILTLLRKAGCDLAGIGAESGSQKILDMIKKDIRVEDILLTCKVLTKYKIRPQFSFMIGLPSETKEDMYKTVRLIDSLLKINKNIDILGPQKFRPYPGGELYTAALKTGWKEPKSLEEWGRMLENEWNYLSAHDFPWVKNPYFVEALETYVSFGARTIKNILTTSVNMNKPMILAYVMIAKIRWKLKFFSFPMEYVLAKKIIKLKNRLMEKNTPAQ